MGLFKKNIKEVCIVEKDMWNIFTKVPRRAIDLRQGWHLKKWTKLDMPLVELIWITRDEIWEERRLQYAWLFKDGAEVRDGLSKILVESDGFIYNDVRCKHIILPSPRCGFGCRALMLRSPNDALNRLWRLYNVWLRRKVG